MHAECCGLGDSETKGSFAKGGEGSCLQKGQIPCVDPVFGWLVRIGAHRPLLRAALEAWAATMLRLVGDADGFALQAQPDKSQGRPPKSPGSNSAHRPRTGLPNMRSPRKPLSRSPDPNPAGTRTTASERHSHAPTSRRADLGSRHARLRRAKQKRSLRRPPRSRLVHCASEPRRRRDRRLAANAKERRSGPA